MNNLVKEKQEKQKPFTIVSKDALSVLPPESEPDRQEYYMDLCHELIESYIAKKGKTLSFNVTTFGCQMNAHDSEKLIGILEKIGLEEKENEDEADVVIFNTCTVRENANQKLYGHLGSLKKRKESGSLKIIGICGCMMQQPEIVEHIRESYRFVDLVFGTFNFYKLAELLYNRLVGDSMQVIEVLEKPDVNVEQLPEKRKFSFKSGVNIMYGCNNFCTFCIVPYVRGRERSRLPEDILGEVKRLADQGYVEVMLLGQNVNSYGVNYIGDQSKSRILADNPDYNFPDLMNDVCKIEGIKRVRFMTSHPKDLSDKLIDVIAENPKIARHIHLPVQSGSTEILRRMNRRYSKEAYLSLVERIREKLPDVSLTTDIMVGFPGETDQDIEDTIDIIRKSRYDQAFTFIYSIRTGTPAAKMEQTDPDIVNERFNHVLEVVREVSAEVSSRFKGSTKEVLVECENDHMPGFVTGRMDNNLLVHFPGDKSLIGSFVNVYLEEAKGFYYLGKIVD
ncbi:MAG: tRNA (N6-isopentenyl adenosine(37)-C2)-methylthiotransferase MiaB [Eubacterium sp.]|nr:tRNA (N6-isopentenyl adenosine(37)-C2)-methylthiotransferase MiaB [Eubacterium sp.]